MAMQALPFCLTMVLVLAVLLLLFSWSTLAPTEAALKYNFALQTVDRHPIDSAGLKWMTPFCTLIKFDKTVRTLSYSEDQLLQSRTKDGLPLTLSVTFQYMVDPKRLYQLYTSYYNQAGDYEKVLRLMGIHLITEIATNYTAADFFSDKNFIANEMRKLMNAYFWEQLYANVTSLQIIQDSLPEPFTDAITTTSTSRQNITTMEKWKEAELVKFETQLLVAGAQANMTIAQAHGDRSEIYQHADATRDIIDSYISQERSAYGQIKESLNLTQEELLEYIYFDTLGGGGVSRQSVNASGPDYKMFVGLNPAAYISERGL